jgi:FMN reductase (NADPH)
MAIDKDLNRAFNLRFGVDLPGGWNLNHFILNQLKHSTCRAFKEQPMSPELLEALMAAAQSSPSSGTLQTYSVIAIRDKEQLSKFYSNDVFINILGKTSDPQNIKALKTCSVFLIWVADLHRIDKLLQELKIENSDIPDKIINQVHTAECQLKAIVDTTIFAQSFTMCAESMNLGVMYCGWLRQMPIEFLEREFNLPKLTFPLFGMCVGYPDQERSIRPRYDTDTILHMEKYKDFNGFNDMKNYEDRYTSRPSQQTFKLTILDRIGNTALHNWTGAALNYMGFKFK